MRTTLLLTVAAVLALPALAQEPREPAEPRARAVEIAPNRPRPVWARERGAEPGQPFLLHHGQDGLAAFNPLLPRRKAFERIWTGPDGDLSPDRQEILYIAPRDPDTPNQLDVWHDRLAADGEDPRRLTFASTNPIDPRWMPDGRDMLYVRGKGEHRQVYLQDVRAEKRSDLLVSDRRSGAAIRPRVSRTGHVAYLVERERNGKEVLYDLVVYDRRVKLDRDRRTTVVHRRPISEMTWSPDGGRIAYSTHGSLVILDLRTKQQRVLPYDEMDARLYAHHATSLDWKGDGTAIVAFLKFSGGRAILDPDDDPYVFGDREAFVIPTDDPRTDEVHYFEVPRGLSRIEWWNDWTAGDG